MSSDDADNMNKLGLVSVLYDLRAWMLRTENDLRYKAKQRAKVDDRDGRKECWEQAEGIALCRAKLDELRNRFEADSRNGKRTVQVVVKEKEPDACVDSPSVYLPTPEEIAAKTAEIRGKWSESELQSRHWQKTQPVELGNPTNFIF